VVSHGRHDKVKIFKMRRRKHYQKHQGHRQNYTELRIDFRSLRKLKELAQMAHKKAGGSSRNGRDSQSKRLGVKRYGGNSSRRQHHRSPARHRIPPGRKRRLRQGSHPVRLEGPARSSSPSRAPKRRTVTIVPAAE
jgi:hypothetical protein